MSNRISDLTETSRYLIAVRLSVCHFGLLIAQKLVFFLITAEMNLLKIDFVSETTYCLNIAFQRKFFVLLAMEDRHYFVSYIHPFRSSIGTNIRVYYDIYTLSLK